MNTIYYLLVVLITNTIQGITGFAGTVLAMPFCILLFGIDTAKACLTLLTTLACILIVARGYRDVLWREFFKMFVFMFVGVFLGEYLYRHIQASFLLLIYAFFIIFISVLGLLKKDRFTLPAPAECGLIVAAGIIHGMFISGGPLLILYAVKKIPEKRNFRVTLSLIWISLNIYLIIKQYLSGMYTPDALRLTVLAIPALLLGVFLGGRLAGKMSQALFLKITYILLLISGGTLLLN